MANGNGNGDSIQPIHSARTFAPVQFQGATVAGASSRRQNSISSAERRPRLERVSFDACDDDALGSTPGNLVLAVPGPTLFSLLQTTSLVPGDTARLDAYWRALGEDEGVGVLGFAPEQGRRMTFVGPYAYLPSAGRYEVVVAAGVTGGTALHLDAEMAHDVSPDDWASISQSPGSHWIQSYQQVLAAATPADLVGFEYFFRLRKLMVTATGANRVIVRIGVAAHNCEVNETLVIDPEFLGRHTVQLESTLGSEAAVTASYW